MLWIGTARTYTLGGAGNVSVRNGGVRFVDVFLLQHRPGGSGKRNGENVIDLLSFRNSISTPRLGQSYRMVEEHDVHVERKF